MNYEIARMAETQGKLILSLCKSGNKYNVQLYNDETKEFTSKLFNSIDDAFIKFTQIAELIIKGMFSEADKRKMLVD